VRIAAGIVAIPLAPFLYRKHYLVLTLMRPTKEVLLFCGFLVRQHKVHVLQILVAAIPLSILGVWLSFAIGRAHAREIREGDIPKPLTRMIPREKIKAMQRVLRRKGSKLVLVGRLAVFPSTVVAMAAGSSKMETKTFLAVDGAGGALSIIEVVAAGFVLGAAYKHGKAWITGVGVAALVAFGVLIGRYLRRE
jgi:membrane protein DedA with SNARE-associated domain